MVYSPVLLLIMCVHLHSIHGASLGDQNIEEGGTQEYCQLLSEEIKYEHNHKVENYNLKPKRYFYKDFPVF